MAGAGEVVAAGAFGQSLAGVSCADWAAAVSPWRAILLATHPYLQPQPALGPLGTPVHLFVLVAMAAAAALNVVAVVMVRRWNCTSDGQFVREETGDSSASAVAEPQAAVAAGHVSPSSAASTRRVWDNPILWREIRTWAYGRKILAIRLVYLLLFGVAAVWLLGPRRPAMR